MHPSRTLPALFIVSIFIISLSLSPRVCFGRFFFPPTHPPAGNMRPDNTGRADDGIARRSAAVITTRPVRPINLLPAVLSGRGGHRNIIYVIPG